MSSEMSKILDISGQETVAKAEGAGNKSEAVATQHRREMRIEDLNGVYDFSMVDSDYKEYLLKKMTALRDEGYLEPLEFEEAKITDEDKNGEDVIKTEIKEDKMKDDHNLPDA